MFNLLPESLKDNIRSNYKIRRFIVVLVFILFLQVTFIVFILPSWLTSFYRENDAIFRTEKMGQSELASSASSTINMVKSINQKLNVIDSSLDYLKITPIINTILSNKTKLIYINSLAYTSNSSTTVTFSINGISGTRESLVSFKKDLDKTALFKNIDLPISNLAKDKDIDFSMIMTMTIPK